MVDRSGTDYKMLRELVRQGEGRYLEFKFKTSHPEKIVREIVAFANTAGGILLIGVGDDGTIPGLKYADEDEYLLVRAIEKHCFPPIPYTLERVPLPDEREVLMLRIPRSPHRPHYMLPDPADPDNRKVYVRVDDKSVQASKEIREIMKGERTARSVREYFDHPDNVAFVERLRAAGEQQVRAQDARHAAAGSHYRALEPRVKAQCLCRPPRAGGAGLSGNHQLQFC